MLCNSPTPADNHTHQFLVSFCSCCHLISAVESMKNKSHKHSHIFTFLHNFNITMEMSCKFTITLLASLLHRSVMFKISPLLQQSKTYWHRSGAVAGLCAVQCNA
ncbi:hypothetical protein T10_455 [Trichinella papuae]|uniref:Uncharacterized protein n=1 Tax=Trichinella papuae TaxID=268474 RepID=A0A0V1N114_9BILA|nr:hypothetical protein T10_455 [Trichinella papuae]